MADTTIALPYQATTSGDQLDASSLVVGAATVKRERMVIGNDTSSAVAIGPTSGALSVSRTPTSLTSGLITLSSAPSISSGVITLSSAIGVSSGLITLTGSNVVTNASSGLVQIAGPITSASSGFVQVYQSTSPWLAALSSGTVTLTNPSTAVTVIGTTGTGSVVTSAGSNTMSVVSSGGIFAPVTSSAGLIVTLATGAGSGGAGSTAINLPTVSAAGFAPVTSSGGLVVSPPGNLFIQIVCTVGIPNPQLITASPARVYSVACLSTQATSQYFEIYNSSSSGITTATTFIPGVSAAAANSYTQIQQSIGGVIATGGLTVIGRLALGSTGSMTAQIRVNVEYSV